LVKTGRFGDMLADRQTDRHAHTFIAILRFPTEGEIVICGVH